MILSKKATALVGAAAAIALGLTACSGSSGGGADNSSAQQKKEAKANTNQINAMPYSQVPDGGTLRWPIDSYPTNFNPAEVDGNELGATQMITSTLPQVWNFNSEGEAERNDAVVDKAEQTSSDPQTIEYHINSKAVWSGGSLDGKAMDYQDFANMWKALNGKDTSYKVASTTGYDQIKSVERGATDQDVKVVFSTPFPDWKSLFGTLLPRTLTASASAFNTSWSNGPDVSGGPFKVSKLDKSGKVITVVRNDKWFGNKAKLEQINFIVIDQDATAKALQSDQIDFVDTGSSAATYATVKGISGVQVRKAGGPNWRHIDLSKRGFLADEKVRQAVVLSIDREGDAKALLSSLDWPARVLDSHIWMNNQAQYKSTCGDFCNRDVSKADSLLQQAGFTKGSNGIYAKGGKALNLQFVIPAGVATSANEAQLQQNALKQAGIQVTIKTVPSDPFFPQYVLVGQFDLTIFSWIGTQFPLSSSKSIYVQNGGQNYAKIGNSEIDTLFNQATTTPDENKATDLTYQIDQKIWEEGHSVPLYQRPDVIACKSTLVNYGAFGFANIVYENIGFSK